MVSQILLANSRQLRLTSRNATLRSVSSPENSAARWLASRAAEAILRTRRGPQQPLAELAALRHAQGLISRAETLLIDAARTEGRSWAEIAAARGTTRQNEHQADQRRQAEEAREPIDRWLDRYFAARQRDAAEERRRQVIGW